MLIVKEAGRGLVRHGRKSVIAVLVSAALAFFLFLFSGIVSLNRQSLEELESNAGLRLIFTNTSGSRTTGLIVYDDKLQKLEESGLAKPELYAAKALFADQTSHFEGYDSNAREEISVRYGDRGDTWSPNWVYQNLVAYNTDSPLTEAGESNVVYFDGYDSSVFQGNEPVCLMLKSKYEELGLSPGDEYTFMLYTFKESAYGKGVFKGGETAFQIVGTYEDPGSLFSSGPESPIELICPYNTLRETLHSFHLNIWPSQASLSVEPENLNALKSYLQELKISPIDRSIDSSAAYGKTAIINDSAFIGTAEPTMRTISLLESLYPLVFAAVALIAFLVSYLLMQNRREETAIQRSLGAGRLRIFLSLFLESAVLCLVGTLLAALPAVLLLGAAPASLLPPACGYFLSYLAGCAAAVLLVNRTNVIAILTASE